jgi:hypothetical protein
MKMRISVVLCALILLALACNLPTAKATIPTAQPALPPPPPPPQAPAAPAQPQSPGQEPTATLAPTPTFIKPADTAVAQPPAGQPAQQTKGGLTETDACKLYSVEKATALLGDPVIPPTPFNSPGYSVCTLFTQTGKGIYIGITMGDQARKNFLNEIAQYQKGCSVSYSGGTSTATPFPPDIEAMMSKSVLELFEMDLKLMEKCGTRVDNLPEFGPNAYVIPTALKMGTVGIISGDNYYSFSYADPKLDIGKMQEKAKEITRDILSK